jgi:hypothetical protein
MKTIKYTVLIGYYSGLIPGLVGKIFKPAGAFIIVAVMSAVSFIGLGIIASNGDGSDICWIFMIIFLFFGAMSCSIAIVTAIATTVKSFPRIPRILLIVIMITYFKISPYLEFSIRNGFFEDPNHMKWFSSIGIISAIVFSIAAVAVKEVEIEDIALKYDKVGLFVYIAVELVFLAEFYIAAFIYENWFIGAILFLVTIFLNFIIFGTFATFVYIEVISNGLSGVSINKDNKGSRLFRNMLKERRYIALVISAFFVIGICSTFNFKVFQIAFSYNAIGNSHHLLNTFWAGDMFARFIGGLLAYYTFNTSDFYRIAFYATASAAIGFGLCILTEPLGVTFFFIANMLISFGVGLFWVLVPLIVLEDAGEEDFGLTWGLTMLSSVLGITAFGIFFD